MKTITKTYHLYTAAELKEKFPKAFDRAVAKYNDTVDETFWSENVTEDLIQVAALMGFDIEVKEIQWSGFCSQGDGASFTGTAAFDKDALEKVKDYAPLDEELHRIAGECAEYGRQGIKCKLEGISHHYCHENTVGLNSAWTEDQDGEITYVEDSEKEILETCRDLMRWLYRQLEKAYEYHSSPECFLETAELNDWNFTENGTMENR